MSRGVFRSAELGDAIERLGADGAAPFYTGDVGTAILDWELAAEVADVIGLDIDEDELEDFEPIGDLSLFADFGFDSTELALLCGDVDLYPDEQVRTIAKRMGFLPQLSAAIPAG